MEKIRYSDEFVCPKCGRHTALVCHVDGTHQAHCMICDAYYNVEIATMTNAEKLRTLGDEELAELITDDLCELLCGAPLVCEGQCKQKMLDWLKQEVSE